ncbi:glucokinase [Caulobacter ginsengisoli]|uniref:Glucokinase n=1 Tax=Caulobacter ginsengisoli TaxID=400775 RepID=A0ABU0INZ2_9CAUL|nr:glucokinase [Caulobacter ginsengisoli]MDQ0463721.1 glucokinase [Caulobacter ginsengisoli]
MAEDLVLVGDIGGTNARFGLARAGSAKIEAIHGYEVADYPQATDAIRVYLEAVKLSAPPARAAIAVAGPIIDGAIDFTNSDWLLSEQGLREMGFGEARLLNDFAALALAAPAMTGHDLHRLGHEAQAEPGGTLVVMGPGTGFGVSALAAGRTVVTTEGGHAAFAPGDEVEDEVLRRLRAEFGRVSIERLLSGPGICSLHRALADMAGRPVETDDPAAITKAALAGDPASLDTLMRFCGILGAVAGDLALGFGATGGVYIAGGIPPRILDLLDASPFRARFEDKGRFKAYVARIPTQVIVHPHAALVGAALAASPAAP